MHITLPQEVLMARRCFTEPVFGIINKDAAKRTYSKKNLTEKD
jgi:hypothetical protein